MKKIGIVSCDKWKGVIKEDLLLEKELISRGHLAEIISWEDCNINYDDYACLILKSVWGYQDKYIEFKNWLLYLKENNIKIFNDVDILLNNIRKDKQFQILDKYLIPHIHTTFIKNTKTLNELITVEEKNIIKPIISGSGNNTYKLFSTDGISKVQERIMGIFESIISTEDNGAMLQPYIPEIKNGEYACIFIGGTNTHNMLRYPGIFIEKKKPIYLVSIPEDILKLAYQVSNIPEFQNYLYMRVDIVYNNKIPNVMEVELAEPDLLIKYIPNNDIQKKIINHFVKKIERKL